MTLNTKAALSSLLDKKGFTPSASGFEAEARNLLSGASDEAIAQSLLADKTVGLPSPSTIASFGSTPVGTTTPSLSSRQNQNFSSLSPRPYFRTDPGDNRYDFASGQKVRTGIGTNPLVNSPQPGGSTAPALSSRLDSKGATPAKVYFYNEFGDAYTQTDIDNVEQLKSFNDDLGGGAGRAKLTPGERAYAISKGYI